jgi:dihydrofolate synthase/folylpolyglutamate synthase
MGLAALCEALEATGERFRVLVFQAMRDKTLEQSVLKRLQALADTVIIPSLDLERACDARELAGCFGHGARAVRDLQTALLKDGTVLLCGSLYLVGAYYKLFPEQLL